MENEFLYRQIFFSPFSFLLFALGTIAARPPVVMPTDRCVTASPRHVRSAVT